MDHLDFPDETEWNQRREWFEELIHKHGNLATSTLNGNQATALIFEMQCCFCAGAWVAVIMLTISVIEANIDEMHELPNSARNVQQKIELLGLEGLNSLRLRRNKLVHFPKSGDPGITIDDQFDNRKSLQKEAEEAVLLMFQTFDKPVVQ